MKNFLPIFVCFVLFILGNGAFCSSFYDNLQLAAQSLSSYADRFIVVCDTLGVVPTMTGSGSAYFVAFDRLAEANSISQSLRKHGFKARVCNDVPCGVEIAD